jgi:glycosyltransferase involved in cell wall biosynthesis
MKILWLSHFLFYPPHGGASQRSYNLCVRLAKYHEVTALALVDTARTPELFHNWEAQVRAAEADLAANSVKLSVVPRSAGAPLARKVTTELAAIASGVSFDEVYYRSPQLAAELRRWIKDFAPDVIHCDTVGLSTYLDDVAVPYTLTHHNVESHMMSRRAERADSAWERLLFRRESGKLAQREKIAGNRAAANFVCSALDGERLSGLGVHAPTFVIPNGVDTTYFRPDPSIEAEPGRLIFVGGMTWYPNRDAMTFFAREVWPRLVAKNGQLTFDLVGRSAPAECQELARQDSRFRVHGFVEDVRPYLNRAEIFVCPIRDGGGTKLKVIDAMAMGKAIVAHPTACEGIDLVNGVDVVLADEPESFADRILDLLSDLQRRKDMARAARQRAVEQFDYDAIGKRLAEHYAAL